VGMGLPPQAALSLRAAKPPAGGVISDFFSLICGLNSAGLLKKFDGVFFPEQSSEIQTFRFEGQKSPSPPSAGWGNNQPSKKENSVFPQNEKFVFRYSAPHIGRI